MGPLKEVIKDKCGHEVGASNPRGSVIINTPESSLASLLLASKERPCEHAERRQPSVIHKRAHRTPILLAP